MKKSLLFILLILFVNILFAQIQGNIKDEDGNLLSEVKKEYSEYSAQEIDIEDLVNYIFETSSYKDDFKVEYPEWHKYYGTEYGS